MSRSQLKRLQRKTVQAKQALKSAQSQTRLALQVVAQLEDELAAALSSHPQPEEAQHDTTEETRQLAHR